MHKFSASREPGAHCQVCADMWRERPEERPLLAVRH